MSDYYIIRTHEHKEHAVYSAIVLKLECEAWLPQQLHTTRVSRHAKRHRELWRPVMPGIFFAAVDPYKLPRLHECDGFAGIARDVNGIPLLAPGAQVRAFRDEIERENIERDRLARTNAQNVAQRGPVKKVRPSAKLVRKGKKAENLAKWTETLLKTQNLAKAA